MFKFLQRKKVAPMHLVPGDAVAILLDGKEIMREEFTRRDTIDEIGLAEFTDEFDMHHGVVGVLGKAKE